MRVALLWTRMSGYLNACLRELASRPGVELLVAHEAPNQDAPFAGGQFSWMTRRIEYPSTPDREALLEQVRAFAPDVLLVSGWHIGAFRHVLQHLRPTPLRVLCMDNQWRNTRKQCVGVLVSPWYVRPLYEAVFLPGERQAAFARRLGFADDRIWHGLLCADAPSLGVEDAAFGDPRPHMFGYLGRLSPEKGIQDLLRGYQIYRASSSAPWGLVVAGDGPLGSMVDDQGAVIRSGFVQPSELDTWMGMIGCLVVPSRLEAWGVALVEGSMAALPIIATSACGAAPHLVHDYVNGRIARTGDASSLAECMLYIERLSNDERLAMGSVSRGLARPYTPARWADTILGRSTQLIADGAPG